MTDLAARLIDMAFDLLRTDPAVSTRLVAEARAVEAEAAALEVAARAGDRGVH